MGIWSTEGKKGSDYRSEHLVYYPSYRKRATVYGIISLIGVILLGYEYHTTSRTIYAIFESIAIVLSIFTLAPVLRNLVVTIEDNIITVNWYYKKYHFTADDFAMIVERTGGIVSFRFFKSSGLHQITPSIYTNGDEMQRELVEILGDCILEITDDIEPCLYKYKEIHRIS
jgi:hypothetical protein